MLVRLASRTLAYQPRSRLFATTASAYQQRQQQKTSATPSSPFDTLDILPVQRPDSSAYFMSNPKYADLLSAITTMIQQNQLPPYNKCYFKRNKWIGRQAFEMQHSIQMNASEYTYLLEKLNQADSLIVRDRQEKHTMGLYLNQFRRGYSHEEVVGADGVKKDVEGLGKKKKKDRKEITSWKRGAMDKLGRWRAAGKRKQAIACAWIVPVEAAEKAEPKAEPTVESVEKAGSEAEAAAADAAAAEPLDVTDPADPQDPPTPMFTTIGQVLVNGRPLPDYFVRSADRESVLFPFTVTNKTGQYNVFVRVRGGGHSGQAEACQLAIARALYAANRKQHAAIREAGMLYTDGRRVERKKTGKPKARKSYTWVKR